MRALTASKARRPLVLTFAMLAALALFGVVAPGADAAKPDQILDAQVRSVNRLTCEVTIDTMLNSKGPMKNDIVVTASGPGGFVRSLEAKRGATLRITAAFSAGGHDTWVASVDPRTGEVAQTVPLGVISC